ncbi:MAG: AarF/ABC1/UbiB kinase family protein [Chloroflexi bacterium]|nr:AarF/ABC1/UbiB kinase family protein [Chloroflexota bacterium]
MGGLWVKAGQLISLRRDVLTPEMADELTQLQYRAFGFARHGPANINGYVGGPIETVFEQFESALRGASISQVHRGFLRQEQVWVAIKIQRPDIVPIFERDLRLISWLLRQMGKLPATGFIDWDGMIKELQDIMREEIDYRYESSNLRFMRQKLKAHKVYVPKYFRRYSGPRVITMEMITGVLMSDYLRVQATDPQRLAAW